MPTWWRKSSPRSASTPSCTSPPSPTSTAASRAPPSSSTPTSSAHSPCSRPPARPGSPARPTEVARRRRGHGSRFTIHRFLHVSTDEVYGSLGETGLFTETTPYDPRSPYSASKASSDHLVSAYFHTYGLPVLITNCSNNYGPYQFPEKLIPLIINNALQGKELPVYGDGKNVRDWLYVEDHCRGHPGACWRQGGWGRPTTSAATTRSRTSRSCSAICDLLDEKAGLLPSGDPAPLPHPLRQGPPRPRPPLRHRRRQDPRRARLGALR